MFDKHLTPNLLALALVLMSFTFSDPWQDLLLSTGLFALSGALTNWLAVHMLFERVPGLYGSGVIPLHFEEFKAGIIRLVHDELFSKDKVDSVLSTGFSETSIGSTLDLSSLLRSIDLDSAFDQLVATIMESSFGSMLAMVGGESALQPLREPFQKRMQKFLGDAANSPKVKAAIGEQMVKAASSEQFVSRLDHILRARLDEMTPEMVRDIMQRMIRRHLGWLVVWGGVFGGLIGMAAGLFALVYQ